MFAIYFCVDVRKFRSLFNMVERKKIFHPYFYFSDLFDIFHFERQCLYTKYIQSIYNVYISVGSDWQQ